MNGESYKQQLIHSNEALKQKHDSGYLHIAETVKEVLEELPTCIVSPKSPDVAPSTH